MIKSPQTRINTEFSRTKKHRPRGYRFVRKNSVLSAPSGARTLDTLIKSQTHVRKKNARTPRRMGVRGTPPSSARTFFIGMKMYGFFSFPDLKPLLAHLIQSLLYLMESEHNL